MNTAFSAKNLDWRKKKKKQTLNSLGEQVNKWLLSISWERNTTRKQPQSLLNSEEDGGEGRGEEEEEEEERYFDIFF